MNKEKEWFGMTNKFELRNVDLWYNDFQALYDVSMDIEANAITAFIGPSG